MYSREGIKTTWGMIYWNAVYSTGAVTRCLLRIEDAHVGLSFGDGVGCIEAHDVGRLLVVDVEKGRFIDTFANKDQEARILKQADRAERGRLSPVDRVRGARFYGMVVTVKGVGRFPFDMLHQDRCCPATAQDAVEIERPAGERQIQLLRFSTAGKAGPSAARWKSFGWEIVSVIFHDGTEETVPHVR